jgi:LacI family transcriptional regulator
MPRVIFLTDLTEEYAKNLLKGIVRYAKKHEPWVLCKMPFSYRVEHEVEGVLKWAKEWKADGIIAQFYNTDQVAVFKENGIAAIAQDFKSRFTEIPNITGAHRTTGRQCGIKIQEEVALLGVDNDEAVCTPSEYRKQNSIL